MDRQRLLIALVTLLISFFTPYAVYGQATESERITSYKSGIIIQKDGKILVTEKISVYAGDKIKRGIYRDYPTVYGNFWGLKTKIPFKIISVTKNGLKEPYHTENASNGIRVYIGKSDVFLTPGFYTYELKYEVGKQIGYFSGHDELYYNITGNGWDFTIDKVSATVTLPEGVTMKDVKTDGYTGFSGDKYKDFSVTVAENSGRTTTNFETTKPLMSRQNLTVVVGWPKGYVKTPTQQDKLYYLIMDNLHLIGGLVGTLIVFLYYMKVWSKFGRDPEGKVIIARFDPPEEKMSANTNHKFLSPAATRYINRMGYDDKCITATIIDGAIKGIYKINQKNSDYSIERLNKNTLPSPEISVLNDVFFSKFLDIFHFEKTKHAIIASAQSNLKKYLKDKVLDAYFMHNYKFVIPSVLFSLLIAFYVTATGNNVLPAMAILATNFILHGIFFFAMKVRTPLGREIQDQIVGLKLYLTKAEERRYEMLHKTVPETISMYEKYLPYAVALDIEPQWSKLMDEVLKSISKVGEQPSYSPVWYSGTSRFSSANSLTNSISRNFTGTISSSAVAPGSRSGFSGGGSSGGGGGGGGGGGW